MTSILTADVWLASTLAGDSALLTLLGGTAVNKIFVDVAPQKLPNGSTPATPYLVLQQMSAPALMVVNQAVVWWDEIWLVRCVDAYPGYSRAGLVMNRVRALLHGQSQKSVTGGVMAGCSEEQVVRYSEVVDGVQYRHLGVEFRIYTQ